MRERAATEVDAISRDLDLVVFRLERPPTPEPAKLLAERRQLRQELERLRDRLTDLARSLD